MGVSGVSSGGEVPPGGNVLPIYDEMNYLFNSGEINTEEGKEKFKACLDVMQQFTVNPDNFQKNFRLLKGDFINFAMGIGDVNQVKRDFQQLISGPQVQLNPSQKTSAWHAVFLWASLVLKDSSKGYLSAMRNEALAFLEEFSLPKTMSQQILSWVTLGGQYLRDPSPENLEKWMQMSQHLVDIFH